MDRFDDSSGKAAFYPFDEQRIGMLQNYVDWIGSTEKNESKYNNREEVKAFHLRIAAGQGVASRQIQDQDGKD